MAVQRQALVERIADFDTKPRTLEIEGSDATLITYSEGRWRVEGAIPQGTFISVNPSNIPVAASIGELLSIVSLLPPPDAPQAQPRLAGTDGIAGANGAVHPEGQSAVHPNFTCPELAGFRSIRSAVLRETWEEVRRRERLNEVITNVEFGNIMGGVWARAKEAARSCPLGQGIAGEL